MSSDDIANLYRQFGGQPDNYQELGRDNVVRQSRERWPLLADVRQQDAARQVRPVAPGVADTRTTSGDGPLPTVFDEAAAAAAAEEARRHPEPIRARPHTTTTAAVPGAPVEPMLTQEPLVGSAPAQAPATYVPVTPASSSSSAIPAGNELQGVFARLARAPEPPAAPADRDVSLLRRLLRP